MATLTPHYIRRYRMRAAFTQREMAHLLGCQSPATVCQYEARQREPDLRTALAYQVVFGLPVAALFPGIHREVEQQVFNRAHRLSERMAAAGDNTVLSHKRQAVRSITAKGSETATHGAPQPTI